MPKFFFYRIHLDLQFQIRSLSNIDDCNIDYMKQMMNFEGLPQTNFLIRIIFYINALSRSIKKYLVEMVTTYLSL